MEACSAELWGGQSLKVLKSGIFTPLAQSANSSKATWMTAHQHSATGNESRPTTRNLRHHVKSTDQTNATDPGSSVSQQALPSEQLQQKLAELSFETTKAAVIGQPLTAQRAKSSWHAPSAAPSAVCSTAQMQEIRKADSDIGMYNLERF